MPGATSRPAVLLGAAALAGALAMTAAQAATFVYVGNAESNDIHVFALDAKSGGLTEVEKVAIPGLAKAGPTTPMAVSPDKRVLHVGTRGEPLTVSSFSIDAKTGKLTHLGNAALPDSMAYVATDRSGRYLLSASYGGHKLAVSPIEAGKVGPAQQIVETAPNAHVDPDRPGEPLRPGDEPRRRHRQPVPLRRRDREALAERPTRREGQGQGRSAPLRLPPRRQARLSPERARRLGRSSSTTMPRRGSSRRSRASASCRPASTASPGRRICTSRPTASSSMRASAPPRRLPPSRSMPRTAR